MNPKYEPFRLNGYVLAGGLSTRMGKDKAKVCLCGKPLIAHAVEKLRGICEEVRILSSDPELVVYGQLVPDHHPGCGPLGGMESALSSSVADWHLFVPVDVPLLPPELLARWAEETLARTVSGVRMAAFVADGELQPAVLLLHRDTAPAISLCIAEKRWKLAAALAWIASMLAEPAGLKPEQVFRQVELTDLASPRWFSNLNTPEDLSKAEAYLNSHRCQVP